jgi:beta-lactamase class A
MGNRGALYTLRWVSVFIFLSAVLLLTIQLVRYSRLRASFPPGMVIAGVPVGGLDRPTSAQRLLEVYTLPVELHYGSAVMQLDPAAVGFQLDLESMLTAADLARNQQSFWVDFWNFLWGRSVPPVEIPLRASFSEARLRTYLNDEIAARYDKPPTPPLPTVGTVDFKPGVQGTALDIDRSVLVIEAALNSSTQRKVDLILQRSQPPRPAMQNLEILLKQTIDLEQFDGLVGLYLLDLQTAQEIHFEYRQGKDYPVEPDVAFTAASTIKIPIMVSVFQRLGTTPDSETVNMLEQMIEFSHNEPADWLMEHEIDKTRGPLEVTADMQILGLKDTFLAGEFYQGAPLLESINTPGNQRTDINTDPDVYNQTSPSDMGMLLEDIYQCSQFNGGALIAAFGGEITQTDCRTMIDYLSNNKLGSLIEAGVPEGTQVAHKHGWVTYFGIMYTLGDAGIVFTPGGNYVLVIYLNHPQQLVWEPASKLVADLSRAVYNFYNIPTQ